MYILISIREVDVKDKEEILRNQTQEHKTQIKDNTNTHNHKKSVCFDFFYFEGICCQYIVL